MSVCRSGEPAIVAEGAESHTSGADVLCGVRSYVQTRFLATEDSSTLTTLVRLFVFKNIHNPTTYYEDSGAWPHEFADTEKVSVALAPE